MSPPDQDPTPSHDTHASPKRIGPYEILEPLGEGGMGVVYLAEQQEPVSRQVALKVIKPGMDTREVINRFEAERQALAVMDHPNIAKVFDGGATEDGRPYFVMELVHGVPITDYCDRERLSIEERLELFIPACQAVQHAHQKGIIHRDLKPSNILVTDRDEQPVPKVIDFGIAKAVDQRLSEHTIQTQTGHLMGTPAYMSPEQVEGSGLDIDTRADIYSLGVILYELLAGELPFEEKDLQGLAALYTVLEKDPPTPSTRFAALAERRRSIAESRRTDSAALARTLKGDLNWIAMKAMEKDRGRRYETANALVFELNRFLNHEPVLARAPGVRYRLGKFVKRHRAGVAAAAAALVILLVSSVLVTYWAVEATRARDIADQRRLQAEDLISFMVGDLQGKLQPLGRLEILDDVGDKALEYFAALPEEELSEEELFRRSQSLTQIGQVRIAQGDLPAAMEAFETALRLSKDLARRDPDNGDWQVGLGAAYFWVGYIHWLQNDLDAALGPMQDYLNISEALVARDPTNLEWQRELAYGHSNIGSLAEARGDLQAALEAYNRTLEIKGNLLEASSDDPSLMHDVAIMYNKVALVSQKLGDLAEAEEAFQAELSIREGLVRDDSTHALYVELLGVSHGFLGDLYVARGETEAALREMEAALESAAELFARDTSNADWERGLAVAERDVGLVLLMLGRQPARAEALLESNLARFERLVTQDATNTTWRRHVGSAQRALGHAHYSQGRYGEARARAEASASTFGSIVEDDPENLPAVLGLAEADLLLGRALEELGQPEDARQAWTRALETIEPHARETGNISYVAVQSRALLHLGRVAEARPLVDSLLDLGYREASLMALARAKEALGGGQPVP